MPVSGAGARLAAVRALEIEVAARAALAAVVPLAVLVAVDRAEWVPYAAFGAMTAIFGRGERYRVRARTVATAAAVLVASVAAGTALAAASAPLGATAAVFAVLVVVGTLVVHIARLGPPTVLFFAFALLVCAAVPVPPGEFGARVLVAALAAGFALALSLSGWLLRRFGGARVRALLKQLPKEPAVRWAAAGDPAVWRSIAAQLLGAAAAGGIALALGIGHPYWAVVSLIAVLPPAGARHSTSRAWHRVIGTVVGVAVTGLVLWPDPPVWVLVAVIGLAQFGAEVLVGRHYGAALVCITPLALVVAHLAAPEPLGPLLVDRVLETAIGCAVGILVVLGARAADRAAARRGERSAAGTERGTEPGAEPGTEHRTEHGTERGEEPRA